MKKTIVFIMLLLIPSLARASALSDAASTMVTGEWKQLNTNGLTQALLLDQPQPSCGDYTILNYTDRAVWDATGKVTSGNRVFIIGSGHNSTCKGKYIQYLESTNTWSLVENMDGQTGTQSYEHVTQDTNTATIYLRQPQTMPNFYRKQPGGSWERCWTGGTAPCQITGTDLYLANIAGGQAFFPEMGTSGSVIDINGRDYTSWGTIQVFDIATNKWSTVVQESLSMGPYHNFAQYSPIHRVVVGGGGNDSKAVYRINSDKTYTRLTDAPHSIGVWNHSIQAIDPVTGNLLVWFVADHSLHSLDPTGSGTWTDHGSNLVHPFDLRATDYMGSDTGAMTNLVAVSIPTYNVIMFIAYSAGSYSGNPQVWLYRHSAATSGRTIHIYPGTDVFGTAAENLIAGDTLIVHQGTYNETNRMSLQVQGTPSAPIIIKAADNEAKPVITRPGSSSLQNTINVEGSAKYLTIKGLEIIGNGGDGIALNGSLSYITIEDNVIHDVDVGIGTHTNINNITIRKNHIYNTGRDGGTGEGMYIGCNYANCVVRDSIIENNWIHDNLAGTTQGDGIEIKYGSINNIIKDNVIYNMFYPGIFVYGYAGSTEVNTVEGNVIWNCLEGIYAPSDAIVRNNIVFNSGTGLSLYGHSQVSVMENVTAVNNTLYNNDDGLYIRWGGSRMTLANNAIYSLGKTAINSSYGISGTVSKNYVEGGIDISIDNNKFFSGGSAQATFTNPSTNDFWPKSGSILIGNANATYAPTNDFNLTSRNSPYDVGAYETNGLTTNPGWKITTGFKSVGTIPQLKGDVNQDSAIDILDIQALVNHILGTQDYGSSADVNSDSSVDVLDVQEVVNVILGTG